MFVPICVVVLMSFNEPDSQLIYQFDCVHLGQLAESLR